jgi:uncharacterized protein (DUF1330 family)
MEDTMAAYVVVVRDEITNPDQYAAYAKKAGASFAGHDVKYLAANGALTPLEGDSPDGVILIEFPTVEAARAWYFGPAYQAVVGDRLAATSGRAVIVEGLPPR